MKSEISLNICIDDERLAYLLENRLLFVEDLKSCNLQTKSKIKALLLRSALKQPVS
jgi:hypothetical protein|tara:strand:+ start:10607 stop:10774 length:168 start_codon:yes stop_codon:yes gene_type:complete